MAAASCSSGSASSAANRPFPGIVSRLFGAWTAYQLALKMKMGGQQTMEKALWFEQVLVEFMTGDDGNQSKKQKKGVVSVDDLTDWIDDVIFHEFDLIVEDGSTDWIADALLKCHKWSMNDQWNDLDQFMSRLPDDEAVRQANSRSHKDGTGAEESSSESDTETEERPATLNGHVHAQDTAENVDSVTAQVGSAQTSLMTSADNSDRTEEMTLQKEEESDGWTTVSKKKGKRT